ncbi:MAG: PolC-type DNA polymerase III [Clostridia bacterium]|nr:PolC-type DNA polymerase III [Clostridia bacterium]
MGMTFLEKFNKYHPDGEEKRVAELITDYKISVNRESRIIRCEIFLPSFVDKEVLYRMEEQIRDDYKVQNVRIYPKYPPEIFREEYIYSCIKELQRTGAVSRGFFDSYSLSTEGNTVYIDLRTADGGIDLMYSADTPEVLSGIIRSEFSLDYKVIIRREEGYSFDYDGYKSQNDAEMMSALAASSPREVTVNGEKLEAEGPKPDYITSFYGRDELKAEFLSETTVRSGNMIFDISEPKAIYGEEFAIEPTPLRNLKKPVHNICVMGNVLAVDYRDTRKGDKTVINFALTDDDASIYCRMVAEKSDAEPVLAELVKNEKTVKNRYLAVFGSVVSDKFDGELSVVPKHIALVGTVPRTDNAPKKRVELHLHTKMSAMDALIPPDEAVETAHRWGHPAVARTDHGNVQGFQDAMLASEKLGQKVIYGMEAYFVDDTARAVYGRDNADFSEGEFCVFDIETTGLSPLNDRITEIGAVIFRNGEILDEFNTFADPGIDIPASITELTGITSEMVAGAPSQADAVSEFLKFAGGRILVAHNASFDTSFIRKVSDENGLDFKNTYIDTVGVSKHVNPDLKRHKLDVIADYYGLGDFNHHRASDDAKMLGEIFKRMIDKLGDEGVKSVSQMVTTMSEKVDPLKLRTYHMILLVRNRAGLKNLYKLVSYGYLDCFKKHPRIPKTVLDEHRDGLIIGSACSEGQLFSALLENMPRADLVEMASYYDYIEIQPVCNNRYLIAEGRASGDEDLREFNRRLISVAAEAGKPVVATCDAHFLNSYDEIYRKILLAGMKFSDADRDTGLYFRTTEEMLEEFSYLGDEKAEEVVVTNTNLIADMIEDGIRPFPKGTFTPNIEGSEEDLQRICYERAKRQYGSPLPEIVSGRLDKELSSIIKNGYAVLYIIAQKLVSFSESQGYLVGSRGSVGSSFVATMAGISEVNPLPPHYYCPKCSYSDFSNPEHKGSGFDLPDAVCPRCGAKLIGEGQDIPFETFLGFHGDKSPDIDLNFSGDVQGRVHKYTEELFGAENVFRAGTIGTLADKTVYGYVMKYLEERKIAVNRAEIQRIENHCVEVKRTTGQHPGGIVVVPKEYDIYDFCPVQHPADDSSSDIVTTHFTFEYLHDTLLKLDELGHDIPTKYKWLEKYTGTSVLDVPMNAAEVYRLFTSLEPLGIRKGEIDANIGTYGLPEFGTRFVMKMVEELQPKCFADLLQISGLSHGTGVWTGNAQDLISEGTCTISEVIGCRDNIMNDLIRYGVEKEISFAIMESVRKGKGLKPEWVEKMRGANVPEWYIDSCRKDKYFFPKAHAAAYVMSAIRLGWYKIHYPVEFYAGFLSAAPGGFDAEIALSGRSNVQKVMREISEKGTAATQKESALLSTLNMVSECYARGVKFLPVDYEKSEAFAFVPESGKIRVPFNSLAGVGDAASQAIVDARKHGNVISVEDLRMKAKLNKSVIDVLKKSGALSSLSETNQITFF